MLTKEEVNDVSYSIIKAAIEVHDNLGPGLLESIYEDCIIFELEHLFGCEVVQQAGVPVYYKGHVMRHDLKLDLLVEGHTIVELKSVERLNDVHRAQLLTYMSLAKKPKGILINFNTKLITSSAIHLVNGEFARLPCK